MTETNKEVSWDEAINSGKFVKLEENEPKELVITNWKLVEVLKSFQGKDDLKIEFQSEVVEEDGKPVEDDKVFTTTSNRLKTCLKEIFVNKKPTDKVKIRVTKIGKAFDTRYSVKELK